MAATVPTYTVQSFNQPNLHEDVSELIWNVDPFQTPILNRSKREKAIQPFHQWDTDIIPAPNPSNLQAQGDDVTLGEEYDAQNSTAKIGNYCGISRKVIVLSDTWEASRAYGGSNHMGYQLLRNIKGLKTDMEVIMTANTAQAPGGGTTTTVTVPGGLPAYLQQNAFSAITYNNGGTAGTGGSTPPSGAGITTIGTKNFANGTAAWAASTGTKVGLTETAIDHMNVQVYQQSGKSIETLVVSAINKQAVSRFAGPTPTSGTVTRFLRTDDDENTLRVAIDYYDHDFGRFEVVPDLFLANTSDVFGIRWDYLAVAFLREFKTVPLAKTGDSDRKMVIVEYTPVVRNEHGLSLIRDTTG